MSEFTYTHTGRHVGYLNMIDGLLGPITVVLCEGELAFSYLAGHSQNGSDALFIRQEIDSPIQFRHVPRAEHPEGLLAHWLDWLPVPEGSDRGERVARDAGPPALPPVSFDPS